MTDPEAALGALVQQALLPRSAPSRILRADGKPVPIMLRKSGGYGYDSTDAAAIRYRLTLELGVTRIIYVVGAEQHQHLEMIFELARAGLASARAAGDG